ncbi:MAG: heme-binding protein [Candidatus Izemoplasma sp.]|nr:heme-binding protein [Candidatus Izemoplasma sp.]
MGLFESIPYKCTKKDGKIEIREYDDFILASTKTHKNNKQDSGFNNVFNYISGDNDQDTKISVTTPVVTYEEDNELVTGFYIPKKNTANIPTHLSDKVFLDTEQSSLFAVIRFRGKWTDKNFDKHDEELKIYLQDNDNKFLSNRFLFRYQPPMVPSIFRRNEIAYKVTKKDI